MVAIFLPLLILIMVKKKNNELSFEIIYKDEGIPENNIIKMNVIHL